MFVASINIMKNWEIPKMGKKNNKENGIPRRELTFFKRKHDARGRGKKKRESAGRCE